jgi:GTP pyrophosphokinase
LVPLDYQLKNGDIIQIISSKQSNGPSRDWLQFVKTSKAKNRIRQWQREQFRGESIQLGRELMERELRKHGMEVHENMRQEVLLEGAKKLGFSSVEDLFASLGDTKVTPAMVIGKIAPEKEFIKQPLRPEAEERRKIKRNGAGVVVRGVEDVLVRFSKCCNPVPGDEIIGFTTRGKGVSVHRSDCLNLGKDDQERIIEVAWEQDVQGSYPVDIEIVGTDRVNLLVDVMTAISELKLYLSSANARSKKGTAYINLTLDIANSDQIRLICNRIKKVEGIEQVYRVSRLVR